MKTAKTNRITNRRAWPTILPSFAKLPLFCTLVLNLFWAQAFAQSGYVDCGSKSAGTATTSTDCIATLIDDLKQTANDRKLKVYVNITVFVPTTNSNTSVWTNTSTGCIPSTNTSVTQMIADANYLLSHLTPTPQLWSVQSLTTCNIQLVLNKFQIVEDDNAYVNINTDQVNSSFTNNITPYMETGVINVFFGGYDHANGNQTYSGDKNPPTGDFVYPSVWPYTMIRFHPTTNFSGSTTWDNIAFYGGTLAHEMGHILGLLHSLAYVYTEGSNPTQLHGDGPSFITPPFGCCPRVLANDFFLEYHVGYDNCGTPGGSNNLMSRNAACNQYLSPQQIAIMHYNLRTCMREFLTPDTYSLAMLVDHNYDYTVSADETWNTERYMRGDVIVKQGKTLRINCAVFMAQDAKILVERGAQLYVYTGTITNVAGQFWKGIEVCGDASQPQTMYNSSAYYTTPGLAQYQGVVRLYQATISNAKNAIATYTTGSNGAIDYTSTGGVVIAYYSDFINNQKDVVFMPYANYQGGNVSKFTECNFITTIDPERNSALSPAIHAYLYKVKGIQFKGCKFENVMATPNYWQYSAPSGYNAGMGIYSQDATFTVDRIFDQNYNQWINPKFNQLDCGVRTINSNPLYAPSIKYAQFTDNASTGAYFKNVNNLVFENNLVQAPYIFAATGVYLNNCAIYSIKNNTVKENTTYNYKASVGIYAYNSKAGAHQVYNNSFSNLEQGISAMGDNSGYTNIANGLKMNCNDFTQVSNRYDIAMLNTTSSVKIANFVYTFPLYATVMQTQGKINNPQSGELVRNRYAAASTCTNCENKWYIDGTSYKTIDHGSNSDANTRPTPQPQNSDVGVNVVNSGIAYNTSHCPPNPGSLGGVGNTGPKNEAINTYLSALRAAHDPESNDLSYDIQAALGEKIAYFVADSSSTAADTIIATIEDNAGFLQNADIMRIYAYMHKGDYTSASSLAGELDESRANWKNLLLAQISLDGNTQSAYGLTGDDDLQALLQSLADNDTIDGHAAAESLLELGLGQTFTEPRLHPAGETGERIAHFDEHTNKDGAENPLLGNSVSVYPNPTDNGLNIVCALKENRSAKVEVKDLLGRTIYTNFINSSGEKYLPLGTLSNGVYILSLKDEKGRVIYQNKIVKQN